MTPPAVCQSWNELLEAVHEAKEALGFQRFEECFYRGHGDSTWQLLPSLMRIPGKERRFEVEMDLFYEFRARARGLHSSSLNGWDLLQFMRHHGVATRLLDWTEVFGVALFFSLDGAKEESEPCIWLLNPYRMNEGTVAERDLYDPVNLGWDRDEKSYYDYHELLLEGSMDFDGPVAVYPQQRSERLHAQRGYFTVHGDDHRPLETIAKESVRRISYSAREVRRDATRFLELAGIDNHLLFPDLDALRDKLHAKYEIP